MNQIRIHGRGGQGNVTLAQLIAMAAFYEGKFTQAFPNFGVERKGAPVVAFTKISDQFIRNRQQIYKPDFIIVQDPSLINVIDVLEGADQDTTIIVNSSNQDICSNYKAKVYCVPVLDIALKIIGKPIINTSMLGAFAKIYGQIGLTSIKKAIKINLGKKLGQELIDKNIKALEEAYKTTEV